MGLEGNSVILSLLQHPHFRDVDAAAPRLLVADVYWAVTIAIVSALNVVPDFIFTITFLVGITITPILEQETVFRGIYNLPNTIEHGSQQGFESLDN